MPRRYVIFTNVRSVQEKDSTASSGLDRHRCELKRKHVALSIPRDEYIEREWPFRQLYRNWEAKLSVRRQVVVV
ncbi:MAG TPA: hypothetical protein VKC66_01920 [Xanthobacteraceae bacterium]|nr:hypothetical protein [Xanthobacteraceae bacterium]